MRPATYTICWESNSNSWTNYPTETYNPTGNNAFECYPTLVEYEGEEAVPTPGSAINLSIASVTLLTTAYML